ncbi:MAG: HD domain-containing protein [Eubacteriales bacterium]|nr:HD domain-containing protein [Eubacteriales bacterium]
MERVNRILKHRIYQKCLEEIRICEKERMFCHHDMAHFMDVARIAQIINLEEKMGIEKERIYAAALLHDIGRHLQYREGVRHELASADIAPEILEECGFSEEESALITEAIAGHRDISVMERRDLTGVIYRADKLSRACFGCVAEKACDWKTEKKNLQIKI